MALLSQTIDKELDELKKNKIRVKFIGRIYMLPAQLRKKIKKAEAATKGNKKLMLSICISYGSRAEIIDAVKAIALGVHAGNIQPGEINEALFSNYLYTADLPDPDLCRRRYRAPSERMAAQTADQAIVLLDRYGLPAGLCLR